MTGTISKKHFLFHLGHPAHFQLFKNLIKSLTLHGHKVSIVIKKKDILESLLQKEGLEFVNLLPKGRGNSMLGIFMGMIKTDLNLLKFCRKNRPHLMIGTSYAISHVGKLLSISTVNVNEDDCYAVPFYAKFSYPWASVILSPATCNNGKWEHKSIKYAGYHELAYLHPNRFKADKAVASSYVDISKPYFLIRFASFKAHHDKGIKGITDKIAFQLLQLLNAVGNIYITSERPLPHEFEKYRLRINPLDVHHVMSFATLYIGDSQTMAAEAGVLGIPFVRFTDFVGRLGYLNELEQFYKLGFGFKTFQQKEMLKKVEDLLSNKQLHEEWKNKRFNMLNDKIDVTAFLLWFIENYPESEHIMREDPDYQYRFK
jgi:predicted glycosyltransferase